jgi:hypothetical protein
MYTQVVTWSPSLVFFLRIWLLETGSFCRLLVPKKNQEAVATSLSVLCTDVLDAGVQTGNSVSSA